MPSKKINEVMSAIVEESQKHWEDYYMQVESEDDWTADYAIAILHLTESDDEFRDYDKVEEAALEPIRKAFPRATWVRFKKDKMPKSGIVCIQHRKSGGLWSEIEVYNVTKMRQRQTREKARERKKKAA
jgi:hypothetical protein